MDTVRIGIIGMGNMGQFHRKYFNENAIRRCNITAYCDTDPERLVGLDEAPCFAEPVALLESGLVDAVLIATPHYDHTTIGIEAFSRGIHVLTEKPISVHKADCERLIAAGNANPSLKFGAMFQMRTYPVYKKIKQIVASGELGKIQRINWAVTAWFRTNYYYKSGGWRATWKGEGGGVLMNQCPHNLDLLQWICGMPTAVTAFCGFGKYHDIETEDEVTAYMEYADGATGVFITSTGEAPGSDRLEIVGDRGTLVCGSSGGQQSSESDTIRFFRTELSVRTHRNTAEDSFAKPNTWSCTIPAPGTASRHIGITQNFVDAILDGTDLIAPAREGIHSVELANAMLYSAWNRQRVELPLSGEAYEMALRDRVAASKFEKPTAISKPVDMAGSFQ